MKLNDIYRFLNEISPFELQEDWDNSGLLIGDINNTIKKIYISLDIDEFIISQIKPSSLLITHHPLIFKGLKKITPTTFSQKYAIELIKKDISLISMHTNFDKTHLNIYFATKILNLNGKNNEFIFYADIDKNFDSFLKEIKTKLNLKTIKFVKSHNQIKKVAITTGAGMSLLDYIQADTFLTGDIKYHDAMEAKARGINLIDIGHYESERFFVDALYEEIKDLKIDIIKLNSQNPFDLL